QNSITFTTGIILATFGNLVVIISIAHFKQLHTPTNVLTLSMAVVDFLIGIFIMPVRMILTVDTCWDIGVVTCFAEFFCYTTLTTISVTHLIFLAVDRYYAVCYPLAYYAKMTIARAWIFVAASWIYSICFSTLIIFAEFTFLLSEGNFCVGFCVFISALILLAVESIFTFIFPMLVMLTLYTKILIVAIQHAKALKRVTNEVDTKQKKTSKGFTARQHKATFTIGIVIITFFSFVSPYFIINILAELINISSLDIIEHLALFNFALNPLIYGLFYPWFRKGLKLILLTHSNHFISE
uniref:G-protein coupled receptors family 1 profile domain-containing protein n=1 Tax=Erpetoichthys calabaricus TaxID=27687 RepID=A0A8C4RHP1_ERPCA